MFAIVDHYAHEDTWLHRWHPQIKIVSLLAAIVIIVSLRRAGPLSLALAGSWGLALGCTVPARVIFKRQKFALLLGLAVVLVAWLVGHGAYPWQVPVESLRAALILTLKVSCVLVLTVPLLASQPFFVFLEALRRLGLPNRLVSMLLLMSRYNLVLADRMQSTLRAAKMRGLRLSAAPARLRPLGGIFGSMVLHSLEQAERVNQAMHLRGFNGQIRASWSYELSAWDALKSAAVWIGAAALLAWDLWP